MFNQCKFLQNSQEAEWSVMHLSFYAQLWYNLWKKKNLPLKCLVLWWCFYILDIEKFRVKSAFDFKRYDGDQVSNFEIHSPPPPPRPVFNFVRMTSNTMEWLIRNSSSCTKTIEFLWLNSNFLLSLIFFFFSLALWNYRKMMPPWSIHVGASEMKLDILTIQISSNNNQCINALFGLSSHTEQLSEKLR